MFVCVGGISPLLLRLLLRLLLKKKVKYYIYYTNTFLKQSVVLYLTTKFTAERLTDLQTTTDMNNLFFLFTSVHTNYDFITF